MVRSNTAHLNAIAGGLSFPTSIALADDGTMYVAEAGLAWDGAPGGGRVLRLDGADPITLAEDLRAPVTGLTWHDGALFVSEGGDPGRISRLDEDGTRTTILDGLPSPGNYHTNMVAFGPDGWLYFSQGAMTNSAVIGLDACELGWLGRLPHAHDLPGLTIELAGFNARTDDPLRPDSTGMADTGAFSPFGTPTTAGQCVSAALPCTAAIMRCRPDGSDLKLVAWGLRNAFGLGFLPDGRLLAIDQGADERGSRPIGNAPDLLFEVRPGAWYGWPDFIGGVPITHPSFRPSRGEAPPFILSNHGKLPPPERPLLRFEPHLAAVKFAHAPLTVGEYAGHLFVALFGDEAPMTAPAGPQVGRSVVRVDPADWSIHPFLNGTLHRPIDVCFHPSTCAMYVLDFGAFEMDATKGVVAQAGTGSLYRVEHRS